MRRMKARIGCSHLCTGSVLETWREEHLLHLMICCAGWQSKQFHDYRVKMRMQCGSNYDCKCVGSRNNGDNDDDDYDDVILDLKLTVIT